MNAEARWLYSIQAHARIFHLLKGVESVEQGTGTGWMRTGKAHIVCSSYPRYSFETSLEPPAHLELCEKCALHDFEAWVVYRCFDSDGAALYVGVTNDLVARMEAHRHCRLYSYRWVNRVARTDTTIHDDRYAAGRAEREAVIALRPIYNTTYRRWAVMAA